MTREEEIKEEVQKMKKPPTISYVAIFFVVAALIAVYFLLSSGLVDLGGTPLVNSAVQAQNVAGRVGEGVQGVSSDLDAISQILGIS